MNELVLKPGYSFSCVPCDEQAFVGTREVTPPILRESRQELVLVPGRA